MNFFSGLNRQLRSVAILGICIATFAWSVSAAESPKKSIILYSSGKMGSSNEANRIRNRILERDSSAQVILKDSGDFYSGLFPMGWSGDSVYEFLSAENADSILAVDSRSAGLLWPLRNNGHLTNVNIGLMETIDIQSKPQRLHRLLHDVDSAAEFALTPKPSRMGLSPLWPGIRVPRLIAPPSLASGPRAMWLSDETDGFHARAEMIRNAKNKLDFTTFLFKPDDVGMSQLYLLRDAARRGVKVRMVLDDVGAWRIPKAMLKHLTNEGIEIRIFHKRSVLDWARYHRRLHDKYVGADDERFIAGGRNAQNAYYGLAPDKNWKNFDDLELYVEGKPDSGSEYFDRLFKSKAVSEVEELNRISTAKVREAELLLNRYNEEKVWNLFGSGDRKLFERLKPIEYFKYSYSPFGEMDLTNGMARELAEMWRRANQEIVIVSPYFILTEEMKTELKAAIDRGVKVRVVTNSIQSNAKPFVAAAHQTDLEELHRLGVEIAEYQGPNMMHAKLEYIDGMKEFYVGSFNRDPRSQRLNSESGAIVRTVDDLDPQGIRSQGIDLASSFFKKAIPVTGPNRVRLPKGICMQFYEGLLRAVVSPQFVRDVL